MSIYSTLQVDRDTALLALARRKWRNLTDEQLGDKLDPHVEANLHNVLVGGRSIEGHKEHLLTIMQYGFD